MKKNEVTKIFPPYLLTHRTFFWETERDKKKIVRKKSYLFTYLPFIPFGSQAQKIERKNLVEIYGVESDMFRDRAGTKMRKQNILVESFYLRETANNQLVTFRLL